MSAGVVALGRILSRLADGPVAAAALAAEAGLARATVFAVAARLEAAGWIRREAGVLEAGPEFWRLAYAAHGLAPLAGPAEPILAALVAATGGQARLASNGATVLELGEPVARGLRLVAPVGTAELSLGIRPGRPARAAAEAALERAREALVFYLEGNT